MKRGIVSVLCGAILMSQSLPVSAHRLCPRPAARVQLALLLDTSNSMDGLIQQAKSQLWRIANELAYARRRGRPVMLEVALYEYGNNRLAAGEQYLRQVLPFTTDLDLVSARLFALTTNGGQEYCGAVIQDAVRQLRWAGDDDVYKVIFIAGNEPFTQGPVYFQQAAAEAARKGIHVNTIFCGAREEGISTAWRDGARAGGGEFLNIDHNAAIVVGPTPYDDEIERLGKALNDTYVGYGAAGRRAQEAQTHVDALAASQRAAGASVERALAKGSVQYAAPAWDAVSIASSGGGISAMRREDLPAELRGLSEAELERQFKAKQKEREQLQRRLADLRAKREQALASAAAAPGGAATLDQAVRQTIRTQAAKRQFVFK